MSKPIPSNELDTMNWHLSKFHIVSYICHHWVLSHKFEPYMAIKLQGRKTKSKDHLICLIFWIPLIYVQNILLIYLICLACIGMAKYDQIHIHPA